MPLDHRAGFAFARALCDDAAGLVVTIGPRARSIETALRSLQEAIDLSRGVRDAATSWPLVRWTHERPLGRLVAALRDDQRMLEHGERMLAPLVDHDLARPGDLLAVLAAIVAHPANRTAAASASHLSRSVFYQRIALIEQLLDVDLDDGETLAALHLALLVRRAAKN
jgi:purine catabolism regulator